MKKIFLLLIIFILVFSQLAVAGEVKKDLADKIAKTPPNEKVRVIIEYEKAPTSDDVAGIESVDGAKINRKYKIIPAISAEVPAKKVRNLAKKPGVKKVGKDHEVRLFLDRSIPKIQADKAWKWGWGLTGKGIKVAVIDTGIDDGHPALTVIKEADFSNTREGPKDLHGHGTWVAGAVASTDSTYRGVAYGADLLNAKVLNRWGWGYSSNVLAGIDWAVENDVDIISMSLGCPRCRCDGTHPVSLAVAEAVKRGITVVVAAGNSGPRSQSIWVPACTEEVITVGSVDFNDVIASYSSKGPTVDGRVKPDLLAPGVSLVSTYLFNSFRASSGTSMSTPQVSGVAALLLEAEPTLTPAEIKEILKSTAIDLGYDENTQGAGRLDAYAAVKTIPEPMKDLSVSVSAPESIVEKKSFDVVATITNSAGEEAVGVQAEIIQFGLRVQGKTVQSLGSIGVGESKEVSWTIKAIKPGSTTITVQVSSDNLPQAEGSTTINAEPRTEKGNKLGQVLRFVSLRGQQLKAFIMNFLNKG